MVTWTQTITVIVNDGCNNDVLSLVSSTFLATYDYYIDENTENPTFIQTPVGTNPLQKTFNAEWTNTVPGCPVDFSIEMLDDTTGDYVSLSASATSVFSLQNPMTIDKAVPLSSQTLLSP